MELYASSFADPPVALSVSPLRLFAVALDMRTRLANITLAAAINTTPASTPRVIPTIAPVVSVGEDVSGALVVVLTVSAGGSFVAVLFPRYMRAEAVLEVGVS